MAKIYDQEINKRTDWGGDESTGNLPVSGRRVQEFIKKTLDGKAGEFYYDTANNRYIVFADAEAREAYLSDTTKTELILATFDAPFNYSAKITLSTPTYVAIIAGGSNNYIDFTFDTMNKSGQSVGEDVVATYTFIKAGVKKTITEKYRYGQAVHFKIDDYISVGTNTITVGIVGQNTLAATTVGVTYQVVDLQLSDNYDISHVYDVANNPEATAAIPYTVSGYGTKVMEWYLDGALLDYVKVEDEIVDVSTTRTKYISLANLSQGIHNLQYRAYTIVDGEKFYSNILYRDLIIVTGANKNPIIAVLATIPAGNDIVSTGELQLYGIQQYVPYSLKFAVYNPVGVASTDATIGIDGKAATVIATHNGEMATYSLRLTEYGAKTLTIGAGETVYSIGINISKSSTSLEPITDALQLDLMALGKSNSDVNCEEWVYGLYAATFTGFHWNKTSGWNNNRLLISGGAYVDINLTPLLPDPTVSGKTLEFEFATVNVSDNNAVICDLRDSNGTGVLITASEAVLKSAGGAEVSTKFKSEENIRIAFVINRKTGTANKGLAFVYVNGILSGAVNYSATDNFASNATLRIGNTILADVELKALRFYDSALTSDQILNNYILYRDTTEDMLGVYDKNNIYEEGTEQFSVNKLAAQCPIMIFTGDIPALENTTDKKKTIYVDIEYINMQDPSKSFTSQGTRLRPQGTSSMGYPKKNFRFYTAYGTMWDSLGNIIKDGLYAFKDGAQPIDCWCLKADYAESSGTHNTGIGRLWNQVMMNAQINGEYVLRTNAQKAALAAQYPYDVRTTVDGLPCNVFYRLTPDSELVYIGKYNFNNDKSTESVFGFRDIPGFDNSKMQCWEVLNNGNHLALFQDTNNFDTEWDQAYEARYPEGNTDVSDLKTFSEWVVSTKNNQEKFKTEKWQHLDVYKVAAYYVYLMRFGAVDQVVKNAMLTSEDGSKFFFINYDNDTINGLRNDGLLIYNYDIDRQTVDASFSALVYAYAGHESILWNNLEADEEFMQIVSEVDNALYIAGLSYEKAIDMFDRSQAGKWCERVFNQDAQYKYISPYTDSGINNLFMLQGSRNAHRRWWLSHRFDLLDSRFVSGAYKAKSIEFKAANAPIGIPFSIVSGNNIYYGYGLNNVSVETGIKLAPSEAHTFISKQVINVGDPVRIYSAVNIQELDIHEFISYLSTLNIAEVYNETVGTKLKKLVLGVDTSIDNRRNTSLSNISGLSQAKRLEYLDISGYQGITNIDLSGHSYLKTLKAYESGLTGLVLANGSPVELLELPDTMQALHFDSLPNLGTGLSIKNYGRNLTNIYIRNCSKFDSKTFVFNWDANRLAEDVNCSLILEGINWTNVNASDLIALGRLKKTGGTFRITGTINLRTITMEEVTQIIEIFGENCFTPTNEIYIVAPSGVFISGPSEILEGDSAYYKAVVFSQYPGKISYTMIVNGKETTNVDGLAIDLVTGQLTSTLKNSNRSITVRVKHLPSQGYVEVSDMNVLVKARTYPSGGTIEGNKQITTVGDFTYVLKPTAQDEINGEYTTEWTINGDAVTQNYIELGDQTTLGCVVKTLKIPEIMIGFTLTAKITGADNIIKATISQSISLTIEGVIATSVVCPKLLAICHAAGFCASDKYITREEARSVTSLGNTKFQAPGEDFSWFKEFSSITAIDSGNFLDCSIAKLELPQGVNRIGEVAFYLCNIIENGKYGKLVLPDSIKIIDTHAFMNIGVSEIVMPKHLDSIGRGAVSGRNIKKIAFPETITKMGDLCFSADNQVSFADDLEIVEGRLPVCDQYSNSSFAYFRYRGHINIPEGVKIIHNDCFRYSQITSVTFPSSLTKIGDYSFANSKISGKLGLSKAVTYNSFAFSESLIEEVEYPIDYPNNYERNLFMRCPNLRKATLGQNAMLYSGLTNNSDFRDCNALLEFAVHPDDTTQTVEDGVLYNEDKSILKIYPAGKIPAGGSFVIPDSVIHIGSFAFYRTTLASYKVALPKTIKSIGDFAFVKANFESLDLENLTSLGLSAFRENTSLVSVKLPLDISAYKGASINQGDHFRGCTSLTTVENVKALYYNMFFGCVNLRHIDIPEGVETLSQHCLSESGLTEITLPSTIKLINNRAIEKCPLLERVVIKGATQIDEFAFNGCGKLEYVELPETLTTIKEGVFRGTLLCNTIISKASLAPTVSSGVFGGDLASWTGYSNASGNVLYVPSGATGYDNREWLDPLQEPTKCKFTISLTL